MPNSMDGLYARTRAAMLWRGESAIMQAKETSIAIDHNCRDPAERAAPVPALSLAEAMIPVAANRAAVTAASRSPIIPHMATDMPLPATRAHRGVRPDLQPYNVMQATIKPANAGGTKKVFIPARAERMSAPLPALP